MPLRPLYLVPVKRHLFPSRLLAALFAASTLGLTSCEGPGSLLNAPGQVPHGFIGPLLLLATFSSEDLACVTAGILASREVIPFWYACLWCWLGILVGDVGLYLIGRFGGERVAQAPLFRRFLTPERLRQGGQMFADHGGWVLFTTRFLPGSRLPAYTGAGLVKYSLPRFIFYLALAGLLWTPAIVGMAFWWGSKLARWLDLFEKYAWITALFAALLAWFTIVLLMPFFSKTGRLLLRSRFLRTLEWEFWPPSLFYLPLLPYAAWLALKSRHPCAFTAANPAIPHGGLVQESKSQILSGLAQSPPNRDAIAPWTLLPLAPPDRRAEALRDFQSSLPAPFPFVLKPDVGERGQGVAVIRSPEQATAFLLHCPEPLIAQEFIPGIEFGVFYYRDPASPQGNILSITQKHLLTITGDGHSTLHDLILHHPRALRMARFFLRQHRSHLDLVLACGESMPLGELGTHCRGALFTDAREHHTEALRLAIDSISRGFPGFFFGRYDLRVPSIEDLHAGRHLKILELNGVSAESTHIYQPGYPLLLAYRDLAEQWRIAFRIGSANRKSGTPATSPIIVLRLLIRHWRRHRIEAPASVPHPIPPGPAQRPVSASALNSPTEPSSTPSNLTGSSPP